MKRLRKVLTMGGFLFAIGALLFQNNMKMETKEDTHGHSKIIRRADDTCEHEQKSGTYIETLEPTCSREGTAMYRCSKCNQNVTVTLAKNPSNHSNGEYENGTWKCCGLTESFVRTMDGWNSNIYHMDMDGTQSWAVEVNLKNERLTDESKGNNALSFVAEVFTYEKDSCGINDAGTGTWDSRAWNKGGWTFRSDWYGWGYWTDNGAIYDHFGGDNIWTDQFVKPSENMDVNMVVKFNADIGRLSIRLQYHSNMSDYANIADKIMIYYAHDITYRGGMRFSFGAEKARVTVNSIKVLSDSELKTMQFAEDWMYMRRNGGNSICGYLTGTNYNTLKDLLDCYNAMTNEEQTRANSLLWNEPCDLATTIAYIESYLAIKGAPAQSSLTNGNLATSTSSSSTYLVIFISLIGILAIAGYYFLNKKRALK